ncbi:MAG: hypothetical protein CMJ83_18020 [Planctomycetes bacterium]|nr:hypothetical protein [Planctomycetota bacterium]
MRNAILLFALVACSLSTPAQTAQVAITFAGIVEVPLLNGACAPAVPQVGAYPIPPFPAFGPGGGLAFDHRTNLMYNCGGVTIEIFPHPLYPPAIPFPAGPFPVPPIPCPGPVIGGAMGPVTGMCMGTAPVLGPAPPGGVLWVTDGLCIAGLTALPPYAVVLPPFPVLGIGGPLTGLDFDSATGLIMGVDVAGVTYSILPGGAFAAPPIPPAFPPIAPVVGNIVDENNGRMYITDGFFVYPILPALAGPIPVGAAPGPVGFPAYGATYLAEPLLLPSACGCTGNTPLISTSTTAAGGSGIPLAVNLSSAQPGSFAYLGVDVLCAAPPFAFAPACFWRLPLPPLLLLGPFPTNAVGAASFPVGPLPPLAGVPGAVLYAQWAIGCAAAPVGAELTDAMHIALSGL